MIFLTNRANLDQRHLHTRLHTWLQTQTDGDDAPIEEVRYHTSASNKVGVRATIHPPAFLDTTYPVAEADLHVSFDFPTDRPYDYYTIQWVEPDRDFMLGWHQDDTHMELDECHLQLDHQGETVQRATANFLDRHPLNVFDQRLTDLAALLEALTWTPDQPRIPPHAVR